MKRTEKIFRLFLTAATALFLIQTAASALTKDADGYYMIGTAEEWKEFAALANGTERNANAKLTADLNFGDSYITDWHENYMPGNRESEDGSTYYKGRFDGSGHTVTLKIKAAGRETAFGLFGRVGEGAVIENLHVAGSVESGGMDVGAVAGELWGASVDKCTNSASVKGMVEVGGIVGGGVFGASVANCGNSGSVTALGSAGGIIGGCDGTAVSGCKNSGRVNGTEYGHAGGIVGECFGSAVSGCSNSGAVGGGSEGVGGIAGRLYGDDALIEKCANTGGVTLTGAGTAAGGAVGIAEDESEEDADEDGVSERVFYSGIEIVGCVSTGSVTAQDPRASYVGGFVGQLKDAGGGVTFRNCNWYRRRSGPLYSAGGEGGCHYGRPVKGISHTDEPGSGSGCSSGFAALALIAAAPLALRRKK